MSKSDWAARQKLAVGTLAPLSSRFELDLAALGVCTEDGFRTDCSAGIKLLIGFKTFKPRGIKVRIAAGPELTTDVHPLSWRTQLMLSGKVKKKIPWLLVYESGFSTYAEHSAKAMLPFRASPHLAVGPLYEWYRNQGTNETRLAIAITYSRGH